jgi:hypothetical protein
MNVVSLIFSQEMRLNHGEISSARFEAAFMLSV